LKASLVNKHFKENGYLNPHFQQIKQLFEIFDQNNWLNIFYLQENYIFLHPGLKKLEILP
jgi:hypothetical protein